MADPEDKTTSKVEDWLENEGYRLEYVTHKALNDVGLTTVMSSYVESENGIQREIDVHASLMPDFAIAKLTLVRLMCECKYSVDKPWILLQSGVPANLWCDWLSLPKSPDLHEASADIEQYGRLLYGSWHFAREQYFAHNLVQAFRGKNRDIAFDSLKKIANAAWDYVETPHRRGANAYLLAIPSIIVDAPLYWACFDHKKKQFVAKKVPYGRLLWGGCRNDTLVDIVQASAINEYANTVRKTFDILLKVIVFLQNKANLKTP